MTEVVGQAAGVRVELDVERLRELLGQDVSKQVSEHLARLFPSEAAEFWTALCDQANRERGRRRAGASAVQLAAAGEQSALRRTRLTMLAIHYPHIQDGYESVGKLLARLRTERGYTQQRLAERLCDASGSPTVTRNEVARWERGGRMPGRFWRQWLARALEVPQEDLDAAVDAARARHQGRPPPHRAHRHRLWRPVDVGDLLAVRDGRDTRDSPGLAHAWLVGTPDVASLAADPALPVLVPGAGDGTGHDLLNGLEARLGTLRGADDESGGLDSCGSAHPDLHGAIAVLRAVGTAP